MNRAGVAANGQTASTGCAETAVVVVVVEVDVEVDVEVVDGAVCRPMRTPSPATTTRATTTSESRRLLMRTILRTNIPTSNLGSSCLGVSSLPTGARVRTQRELSPKPFALLPCSAGDAMRDVADDKK